MTLDSETKAVELPEHHGDELRLWLRLLTCTTLIEGEVRSRLRERFDVTLPRFDLMALQRNLKALGTFGYQAVARANPAYARYVPRTLDYVRRGLSTHRRFGNLHDLLADSLPELV